MTKERPVVSQLIKEHPYALFIFSNKTQDRWHFINVKYDAAAQNRRLFRRISVSSEDRLRTAAERVALLDLQSIQPNMLGLQPLTIQSKHDEAFDVETVTNQFFEEYKTQFKELEKDLRKQVNDHAWAHDYSLQFLNRSMFIYFIQRKGWLGNDRDFLFNFWKNYLRSGQSGDSFVDNWLKVLFFEAFNNKFHGGHIYFPPEIRNTLATAPYLNGGLFTENNFDTDNKVFISDRRFEQILMFLERYNFTISEDSPLDKEVAVDPEMIGKVYESLVNVSEEVDERGEAGIFYTPRTEIDLMCRLSLVDNLANHLGQDKKSLLYQLAFALEPDEKTDADKDVASAGLWEGVNERLHEITVLDPACGSGSFLVGMLNILDDLQQRANQQLNKTEAPYERKKRIIGQTLYGVDVMGWACHTAELRLWLALIIDAEIPQAELHVRPNNEPLLPHFNFKIRYGDSLVQEIGGINFGHKRQTLGWSRELKKRIAILKDEKLKFYNNDKTCRFNSLDEVKQEERNIFQGLLEYRVHNIENEIQALNQRIATPQTQLGMIGLPQKPLQAPLDVQNWKRELDQKQEELTQSKLVLKILLDSPQIPFVWDIAFVEIFESEKNGFDIIIGNPPYVRQEAIAAPIISGSQIITDKKEYKDKLALSVYQAFPHFFGYNSNDNTVTHKIDSKSDLYIYFYLHGLSLLNPEGSFCFITSNSWLDVGYGADLQEFLLKHSHVKLVLDNKVKRSFANADINSIIVLFSAPDERSERALENIARFVMFRMPFEHILSPVIFEEIDESTELKACKEYRIFPIPQSNLLQEGYGIIEEKARTEKTIVPLIKATKYLGNKWGGRYLRAPDILQVIRNKSVAKFQTLGTAPWMVLGRGRRTGADKFFYLDEKVKSEFNIEKEFLYPLVKSPTQFINVGPATSNLLSEHFVFICESTRAALRGTNALEYIKWGEHQGFDDANLAGVKGLWWNLGTQELSDVILPISFNDRFFAIHNDAKYEVHQRFATLRFDMKNRKHIIPVVTFLNSAVTALEAEVFGRRSLGQGALDFPPEDWKYVIVPSPESLGDEENRSLIKVWNDIKTRKPKSIQLEIKDAYKKNLDSIVFDILALTQGERDAVYEAVIDLVEARLNKANSL